MMVLEPRILDKFEIDWASGCWIWTACVDKNGYGLIGNDRKMPVGQRKSTRAHRRIYEDLFGRPGSWALLHHECENKRCVNPRHVGPVTHKKHSEIHGPSGMGRINALKTHCPEGHELSVGNLLKRRVGRDCRECHNKKQLMRQAARIVEHGNLYYRRNRDAICAKRRSRYAKKKAGVTTC